MSVVSCWRNKKIIFLWSRINRFIFLIFCVGKKISNFCVCATMIYVCANVVTKTNLPNFTYFCNKKKIKNKNNSKQNKQTDHQTSQNHHQSQTISREEVARVPVACSSDDGAATCDDDAATPPTPQSFERKEKETDLIRPNYVTWRFRTASRRQRCVGGAWRDRLAELQSERKYTVNCE